MDTTPGGQPMPGPGQGPAPTPPYGPAPSAPPGGGAPPPGYARVPAQGHPFAPAPPARRRSRAALWLSLSGSLLAGLVAVLVGLALLVNSTATNEPDATGGDPTEHLDSGLDSPPPPLEIDVEQHPLYGTSVPAAVSCDLPDLDTSSSASWEAFSEEVGACLDELWQPHLEDLGLRTDTPTFRVTEQNPDSPGQEGMTLAYYQGEKLSVTVVLPNVVELSESIPDGQEEGVWAALLGHEYGHHVQQVTGLLDAAAELENSAPTESGALQALRRTELQAECLGGVAMQGFGTFDDAELDTINEFLNGGNDLSTHGSARNRQHWFEEGRSNDTIAGCNTYEADASLVR